VQGHDALAAAVQALYRIRAVEKPPDAEGLREIWHHCAQGAELISFVNPHGRLVRQELSLLADYFAWTSAAGLLTGSCADAEGSKATRPTERVVLDATPSGARIDRAAKALASYTGADAYLLHIRKVITEALAGVSVLDEVIVTTGHGRVAPPGAAEPPAMTGPRPWMIAAIAAAALIAAAVLIHFTR
jgi:hypothetical protein